MRSKMIVFLHGFLFILLPTLCFGLDERPYVTCEIRSQLGNHLFEVATTLAYAWDNDVQPLFPGLDGVRNNQKHIFFRLDTSQLPNPPKDSFAESHEYSAVKVPYRPDQILRGWFQSWIHFDHHRDKIVKIFSPSETMERYLQDKYQHILRHPNTVGVHVRTFNREFHDSGRFPFVGLQYYEDAMSLFPEDALFVIFSDRINWCKHNLNVLAKNMIFIESYDHIEDLFLMSKLKHNIICNSSYSWWGAYLNINPDKIVITPHYWLSTRLYTFPLTGASNYFYLPDWIRVEAYYDAPYPTDMKAYDTHSQSIDTQ